MRPPRPRLERDEEDDINDWAKANGWRTYKLTFLTRRGAPDRLYGHTITKRKVLMEIKKNGEEPTEQQAKVHEELREIGFEVVWVDSAQEGIRVLSS